MRLAVLGPPGSDRKTIAARLGVPSTSLTDIVQAEIQANTPAPPGPLPASPIAQ